MKEYDSIDDVTMGQHEEIAIMSNVICVSIFGKTINSVGKKLQNKCIQAVLNLIETVKNFDGDSND